MPHKPIPERNWAIRELLSWGLNELKPLGKVEALASTERFLEELSGFDRFHLYLQSQSSLSKTAFRKFCVWIEQRKKRVPVAYLTGKAYFWQEVLSVSPDCLIPRPETELLIEKFIERGGFKTDSKFKFADIGSGSGAIGIALLRHYKNSRATLIDRSPKALAQTRKNLKSYKLLNRSKIVLSDLFSAFKKTGQQWDVVLSNPPYLSEKDLKRAQPEILKEPRQALDGGKSGLDFYEKIAAQAPSYLKEGGWLVLEIGKGQARKVEKLILDTQAFKTVIIFKDLNSIYRVVMAQKKLNG